MRHHSAKTLAVLLAAALTVGLSACGSGGGADLLPGTTASQINSNLDQVRQLVAEGECNGAEEAAEEVSLQVEEVRGVDPELKALLDEGAERLREVVSTCQEAEEDEALEASEAEEEAAEGEEEEDEPAAKHEKPGKTQPEETEPPEPPGQENEKGNGNGKGPENEVPPEETGGEAPSGGLGPGTAVEGE